MQIVTRRALAAAGLALMAGTSAAWAQGGPPVRVRGEITKVEGTTLSIKSRTGEALTVKLAEPPRIAAMVKASLADIKNDSFVGIAGMPQSDDSIEAFSVHIFLPAQRGVVPDRHGPWDARPGSTMTNAYVESMVQGKDGGTLMVKYKDGEKKIVVTPQTMIAAAAPGNKDELKAGAQIIIFGWEKQPDGSILAKTMYVGRGVTPAM